MQSNKMSRRTCLSCKKIGEKDEFIRFIEVDNNPLPDIKGTLPGRGFNICPCENCIKLFLKKRYKGKITPNEIIEITVKNLKTYLLSLLSIAHKSKLTVIGQDNIKKLKDKPGTLILAKDLSKKTKESLKRENYTILENLFLKEEIGKAIKRDSQIGALFIKKSGIEKKVTTIGKKLKKITERE